ncbi:uncharacterized protein N7477_006288 [Penicillium maclennaniae]|uniref:uncharacterized protein n=1 Tax=Penicillium maclennaniae TaxID=1343394 RepID=UPI002540AD5C|nr:uncharacterized protein N7477_006288 [Penicillium maclennaniae]KAJ5667718.1 hypothetical protein N7477_006288 [Penicillium maclennaniae]
MGDPVRPSDDEFNQVLQDSFKTWSSCLPAKSEDHLLPRHAIDLKPLAGQTPPFLGAGLVSPEEISFACEEKQSDGSLVTNGRSTWRTSKRICDLQPRVLPKQLLLAVDGRQSVRLSEDSPLSEWPGVKGVSGYDNGNYIAILYFAWAYILSARWVEILDRSTDHECHMGYTMQEVESPLPPNAQPLIEIELGEDVGVEEALWWRTILCPDDGWNATTKYNGHVYFSPWSVSAKHAGLSVTTSALMVSEPEPASSVTALKYLSRFCVLHHLYAQCSAALAGVLFIPFMSSSTIFLPFPKQTSRLELNERVSDSSVSIPNLLNDLRELLPKYMTLSSNPWGLRSLLCSTFFNPDIECNFVSAWLNPAFAILHSISAKKIAVAALLANRQPRLGILWLGAILASLADSVLRDIRTGATAVDLQASAWSEITQTFLTLNTRGSHGDFIGRDDECRLLFITACEGYDRPPIWLWKPFGFTKLCDTEILVRQHAQCAAHCLEYESWEWILTNGNSIRDCATENTQAPVEASNTSANVILARLDDYSYDHHSQLLSEEDTRGIFEWLRSTGYPHNEKLIYQHSWLDLEDPDEEEESEDDESDMETQWSGKRRHVESWLESIG